MVNSRFNFFVPEFYSVFSCISINILLQYYCLLKLWLRPGDAESGSLTTEYSMRMKVACFMRVSVENKQVVNRVDRKVVQKASQVVQTRSEVVQNKPQVVQKVSEV